MAKHKGKRRRFRKYLRGNVDEKLTMPTMASRVVVGAAFDETVNERTFVSSLRATYALMGVTPGIDDGPIMVGIAHNDYSDAEVEAFIENTGSWNEGDLVNQEVAKRKVRIVGIFEIPAAGGPEDAVHLNDGKPITTKLGWILNQGVTLKLWGYNLGTSPFATTAPEIDCQGHVNLWPQ